MKTTLNQTAQIALASLYFTGAAALPSEAQIPPGGSLPNPAPAAATASVTTPNLVETVQQYEARRAALRLPPIPGAQVSADSTPNIEASARLSLGGGSHSSLNVLGERRSDSGFDRTGRRVLGSIPGLNDFRREGGLDRSALVIPPEQELTPVTPKPDGCNGWIYVGIGLLGIVALNQGSQIAGLRQRLSQIEGTK